MASSSAAAAMMLFALRLYADPCARGRGCPTSRNGRALHEVIEHLDDLVAVARLVAGLRAGPLLAHEDDVSEVVSARTAPIRRPRRRGTDAAGPRMPRCTEAGSPRSV
jgi:hypothetical protein